MLDLTLARIAQEEREREIAQRHRIREIREALEPSGREPFIRPTPGSRVAPGPRRRSSVGGSV